MTVYTQNPLFSIVTPVLNGRQHLDECIQSVLRQSYMHIEHVFVDGGSVDGTMEGLTSYQTAHPHRIRIVSEPGSGPGQSWITGIKAATGEILGCLGVDDICEAGAIEAVADFFRANEPQSIIPFAIQQVVAWGRMPLPDLLAELIPAEDARKVFFKQVGIRPSDPKK